MTSPDPEPPPDPSGRYLVGLSLGALGIVYGDIGTSPLYALRESFSAAHGVDPTAANVMGVLSLIFWSLIILISTKYLVFVLRAANRGEGGILARTALVEGIPASKGTTKLPMMLPEESGVRVATDRAVPETVYSMVTDGVESEPVLVLSAG